MLIFDYECLNCGKKFERVVDSATELVYCTECCRVARKLFPTKINFKLAGDCWAKDGYTKKEKPWEKHMEY